MNELEKFSNTLLFEIAQTGLFPHNQMAAQLLGYRLDIAQKEEIPEAPIPVDPGYALDQEHATDAISLVNKEGISLVNKEGEREGAKSFFSKLGSK